MGDMARQRLVPIGFVIAVGTISFLSAASAPPKPARSSMTGRAEI